MAGAADPAALSGVQCLILRAEGQAEELVEQLRSRGAAVTHCPTIAIERRPVAGAELAVLDDADWLVFVSPNAVSAGLAVLEEAGRPLPDAAAIAAVGAGTARALEERGLPVHAQPREGGGGEALLRHPRLQDLDGQRVVIVRGEGGREHLAQALCQRGAWVVYLEVYRRALPAVDDPGRLLAGWRRGGSRVTIVTSVTGWRNLLALADQASAEAIRAGALVAVSDRVRAAARSDGHTGPAVVADDPGPEALAEAAANVAARL